jgi:hypothetical protein
MMHKHQLVCVDNLVYEHRNCSVNEWAERPGFDAIHNSGVKNVSLNHQIRNVSGTYSISWLPGAYS